MQRCRRLAAGRDGRRRGAPARRPPPARGGAVLRLATRADRFSDGGRHRPRPRCAALVAARRAARHATATRDGTGARCAQPRAYAVRQSSPSPRPRRTARSTQLTTPAPRWWSRRWTCRTPATSARSSAPPMPSARRACSASAPPPTRSAGRPCAGRWAAPCGCPSCARRTPSPRSRVLRSHGLALVGRRSRDGGVATPTRWTATRPDGARRRQRGPWRPGRRRSPTADTIVCIPMRDGRGVAQRRGRGRGAARRCPAAARARRSSVVSGSLFDEGGRRRWRQARPGPRWPSACGRARSTSSSARSTCSRPAGRCARRSSATSCSRSSSGARRAPARRRSRA